MDQLLIGSSSLIPNRWTHKDARDKCWDIGFGRFVSLFPRLRDSHATILLNLRIPEPANIEFYGKCLSGEDFCNFCHSSTPCAAPSEGPWKRKSSHMRTGISQGQLWRTYYVYSGGFKRILQTYLEIQRATNSLPSKDNQHLQKIATSKYFWQCKLEPWILQYTLNKFHLGDFVR